MAWGAALGAAATIGAGLIGAKSQSDTAQSNVKHQREFAKHGIRWKVKDARAAGIHPLAALGAQTHSFTPATIGSNPIGRGLADAGQNIGNAIDANATQEQRDQQSSKQLTALAVERAGLENELLRARIASETALRRNQPGMPTPLTINSIDGQGNAPIVSTQPREVTTHRPSQPGQEPGTSPDVTFFADTTGGEIPALPERAAESYEADPAGYVHWLARNRVSAYIDPYNYFGGSTPPAGPVKKGHVWRFNRYRGSWEQVKPGIVNYLKSWYR